MNSHLISKAIFYSRETKEPQLNEGTGRLSTLPARRAGSDSRWQDDGSYPVVQPLLQQGQECVLCPLPSGLLLCVASVKLSGKSQPRATCP